jgi:hypothetical protein
VVKAGNDISINGIATKDPHTRIILAKKDDKPSKPTDQVSRPTYFGTGIESVGMISAYDLRYQRDTENAFLDFEIIVSTVSGVSSQDQPKCFTASRRWI